jgi:hypothetical protein
MRALIASQLMTLDGFFEGPNHELVPPPWNGQLEQYGVDMLSREVDTILYGRRKPTPRSPRSGNGAL